MKTNFKYGLACLILFQGIHSLEEYHGRLWEVFAPARFLSSLISSDLEFGFIVINISVFVLGILSLIFIWNYTNHFSSFLIFFWIALEFCNGLGHIIWSVTEMAYTPGLFSAFFLLVISISLIKTLK